MFATKLTGTDPSKHIKQTKIKLTPSSVGIWGEKSLCALAFNSCGFRGAEVGMAASFLMEES